jgi:hypothetical protein
VPQAIVGDITYEVSALERDGRWVASARRSDNGRRFGEERTGPTEPDAVAAMIGWLEWQHEHAAALEALQQAERAYHRTVAGSAFASPTGGPTALELQKESLQHVETVRQQLDEVRARRPRAD